jgi:hypothetical protein
VVNLVTGRLDRSIIENETELREEMVALSYVPDRQLRFPLSSLQCDNQMWRQAVDAFLDRADVVVMDLAGLQPENRGVAYEIGRVFAQLELSRVLLLINDTTNRDTLREIIGGGWRALPETSPNFGRTDAAVRLLDIGSPPERQRAEPLAAWQRRQGDRAGAPKLTALLHEMSMPRRSPEVPVPDEDYVGQWSHFVPQKARWVRNAIAAAYVAGQLIF